MIFLCLSYSLPKITQLKTSTCKQSSKTKELFGFKWDKSSLRICCCCSSVAKSHWTLQSHGRSTPGSSVLHYLLEFAQIHVHWVSDSISFSATPSPFIILPTHLSNQIHIWLSPQTHGGKSNNKNLLTTFYIWVKPSQFPWFLFSTSYFLIS